MQHHIACAGSATAKSIVWTVSVYDIVSCTHQHEKKDEGYRKYPVHFFPFVWHATNNVFKGMEHCTVEILHYDKMLDVIYA